jgi:hypothetical protein
MTETTARIRWERNDDGSTVTAAHEGYIGTIGEPQFFIFAPDDRDPWWILTSSLPGLPGAGRAERRAHGDDTDQLRAEAEHWLTGFVSSLGAVFPDPAAKRETWPTADELAEMSLHDQEAWERRCADAERANPEAATEAAGTETTDA